MGHGMKSRLFGPAFACYFLFFPVLVNATTVTYDLNNIGGNAWEYTYAVHNDTLSESIGRFGIVFETGVSQSLSQTATPADWTTLATSWSDFSQTINNYSSSTNIKAIQPGESLGGFSVQFEYLGAGSPGPQQFSVYESSVLDLAVEPLDTGLTQISSIPIPAAAWLFGSGLLGLIGISRRKKAA